MNDFFIASNRCLKLHVGDLVLEIRQITMKDFDLWLMAASEIKAHLNNADVYSDEMIKDITTKFEFQCYSMINLTTDLDIDSIINTKLSNPDVFLDLVRKCIEANKAYFCEEQVKRRGTRQQTDNKNSWFDSLQLLISAGHSHDSLLNMSYGAYKHYLDAAVRAYKRSLVTQAGIVRVAQHAAAREFKKYLDEIKAE